MRTAAQNAHPRYVLIHPSRYTCAEDFIERLRLRLGLHSATFKHQDASICPGKFVRDRHAGRPTADDTKVSFYNTIRSKLIQIENLHPFSESERDLSAGRYSSLFRRQNTLHKQLSGFDFQNAVYYFNVCEGPDHRRWEDCQRLGYLSAGGGKRWRDQVLDISPGDVLIAYLKGHGFVGVGRVTHAARPYADVRIKGKLLGEFGPTSAGMSGQGDDLDRCEYPTLVDWVRTVPRTDAKWKRKSALFTTQHVKASLDNQPKTVAFVEREFDVKLSELIR